MERVLDTVDTKWLRISHIARCMHENPKQDTIIAERCTVSVPCVAWCGRIAEAVIGGAYYDRRGRRRQHWWCVVCAECATEFRKEVTKIQTEQSIKLHKIADLINKKRILCLWGVNGVRFDVESGQHNQTCEWCMKYSKCRRYGCTNVCCVCSSRIELIIELTKIGLGMKLSCARENETQDLNAFIEAADDHIPTIF